MLSGGDRNTELKSMIYVGNSMNPLLRSLDILSMLPYHGQRLAPGDVIAFKRRATGKDTIVTHRIVSYGRAGITTKGDNNACVDRFPVDPADIIGVVVSANRQGRVIAVRGGLRGRAYARSVYYASIAKAWIRRLLRPPYDFLSKHTLFRALLPAGVHISIISLERPGGTEQQLVMGRLIIGKRKAGSDQWTIRPPFRLFINEAMLLDQAPGKSGR